MLLQTESSGLQGNYQDVTEKKYAFIFKITDFVTSVLSEGLPERYVHLALLLKHFFILMTHCRLLLAGRNYPTTMLMKSYLQTLRKIIFLKRPTGMFTVKRMKNNISLKNLVKLGLILYAK